MNASKSTSTHALFSHKQGGQRTLSTRTHTCVLSPSRGGSHERLHIHTYAFSTLPGGGAPNVCHILHTNICALPAPRVGEGWDGSPHMHPRAFPTYCIPQKGALHGAACMPTPPKAILACRCVLFLFFFVPYPSQPPALFPLHSPLSTWGTSAHDRTPFHTHTHTLTHTHTHPHTPLMPPPPQGRSLPTSIED